MILLLLAAAIPACAGCHPAEARSHAATPMRQALTPAGDSRILKENPDLRYQQGVYHWRIRREGNAPTYSVTNGRQTVTAKLRWAFGFGAMGQTFLYERTGMLYEATVSYYSLTKGLDFTPGHLDRPKRDIEEAAGRQIDPAEVRRCFGCHAGSSEEPVAAGVQCGHCHAGADSHAGSRSTMAKLSRSTTEEISNLCGTCHRTWEDIAANGPRSVINVRFQPYRLANSKCYDAADRRISCTACHDPHAAVVHQARNYDSKCLACHARGKVCSVARQDCVTCHMPKTEIPGIHFGFSDHWIRVVRPGAEYPQ